MAGQVKNLSCVINFLNNTDAVFFTGQTVNGTATITLLKPMKVRFVSIIIQGTAKTKWETGSGRSRRIHKGKEILLDSNTVLMGAVNGPETELLAGVYNYNFSCFLPPQLPSTLESPLAKIRYFVKVMVDRPMKFDDKFLVMFTVLAPLDLNLEPATIRHPCEINESKTFCCCCCSYTGFNITLRIPQTGYIPGQAINVDAEISNTSSVKLIGVNVLLLRTIAVRSDKNTWKHEFFNLQKIKLPSDEVMNRMDFKRNLAVTATPPSLTSKLIDIVYNVVVVGKITGCHINPRACIPITIGTNALLSNYHYQEQVPMAMPIPTTSYYNQEAGKSSSEMNDLPPSYKDSMTKS